MSKFLVETHYTCTFKIVHELEELNEKALANIDNRKDGRVEIVNVTVNNRKTKRASDEKASKKVELPNNKEKINIYFLPFRFILMSDKSTNFFL